RNVFVNICGEPHNYGDENNEQGYPSRNNEMDPGEESRGDAPGDSYPHEDERENDFAERKHNFEPQEGDEERGMRQNMDEFRMRSQQIEKIANEAAKKKDSSPLVVHPNGDPRELDIKKAFYEFNPTHKQSKHLASILDFSVRSKIAKRSARSVSSPVLKQMRNGKRGLMVDRLIA
ncbi:MAG: hypothetical protein GY915_02285, partial [bacterium]|nr:hypothetical protein [bacterium]